MSRSIMLHRETCIRIREQQQHMQIYSILHRYSELSNLPANIITMNRTKGVSLILQRSE